MQKIKRNMKRWLAGAVVVLALLVLIVPAGVGFMAEGRYTDLWDRVSADQPGLEIAVSEYERGWFHSRASLEIEILEPGLAEMAHEGGWAREDGDRIIVDLEERVHHGPVPFTAPAPWHQRWRPGFAVIDSRLEENLPAVAETGLDLSNSAHLGLMGGVNGQLRLEPVELEEEGVRFTSEEAILVDYRLNRGLDRMDLTARSGALSLLAEDDTGIVLDRVWLQMNQRRGPAGLWLGGTELRIAGGETRVPDEDEMRFSGFVAATELRRNDAELLEQKHEVHLESLRQGDWEAGPGYLDLSLFNLDPDAFAELQQAIAAHDPEAGVLPAEAVLGELRGPLAELALNRPGVRVNELALRLPEGDVVGEGSMQVVDQSRDEIRDLIEARDWLGLVEGEGKLAAGERLIERAVAMTLLDVSLDEDIEEDVSSLVQMQLDAAVEEGLLERINGAYEVRAEYRDRTLFINDAEVARF